MFNSISPNILQPRLAEVGKIKIGGKGDERTSKQGGKYRLPVKFDHFQVTTTVRNDPNGNFVRDEDIHQRIGDSPRELDIMLLYDDIEQNFQHSFQWYEGKKRMCQGNGEAAQRWDEKDELFKEIDCTCPLLEQGKCKPSGRLSVLLQHAKMTGGVYVFRTHSYNSIWSIVSSLRFIQNLTGGVLAGIPLKMRIESKMAEVDGKAQMVLYVNIIYPGAPEELLTKAIDVAKTRSMGIARLEAAKNMKALPASEIEFLDEDPADIEEEFYPENNPDFEAEEAERVIPGQRREIDGRMMIQNNDGSWAPVAELEAQDKAQQEKSQKRLEEFKAQHGENPSFTANAAGKMVPADEAGKPTEEIQLW